MKRINALRITAGLLAGTLALGLVGCGATAESGATAETAEQPQAAASGESAAQEDPYAYLSDFDYSSIFDENGYVAGVKATDYVTIPQDFAPTLSDAANTVAEEDIQSYINENILVSYAETTQVTDRAAADGDTVNIDFAGSIDGVAFDGGTAESYSITLGSGRFIDNFEEQIVGHMPGESFDVVVTFPEDYQSAELAGKEAVFATTLNYVEQTTLPELTDAWVQEHLNQALGLTSVAGVNEYVRGLLLYDQQANEIYNELTSQLTVADEAPAELVKYFEDYYLLTPYLYSQMNGVTLDEFITSGGFADTAAYLESIAGYIDGAVQQALIMQALAETYGIVCDTDTMNAEIMDQYGTGDPTTYTEQYGETYLKMSILNSLVMEHLIEMANA